MTTSTKEPRYLARDELETMIRDLREVNRNRLADVLMTYRSDADKGEPVYMTPDQWARIDGVLSPEEVLTEPPAPEDIDLPEALDFLANAGMNVVVIDEEGVYEGVLHNDDSIEVDRKMDLLLDDRTKFSKDGNTAFIPQEVLDEVDPDSELDAPAFPVCGCGCGNRTKGGRYLPGHDAKHKGRLMRTVFYGSGEEAEASELELQLRGWLKFYPAFAKNESKRARRANLKRCEICGRPLFDEESIERGVGPVCAGRH